MLLPQKTVATIQNLYESGHSFADIASITGVPIKEVKSQRTKNRWVRVPGRQVAAEGEAEGDESEAADILAAADEALQTNPGKRHSAMVFKRVHAALAAIKTLPPLKTWKDIEMADKIARRAAGLDREGAGGGTVINLGIISGSYKPKLAPGKKVIDVAVDKQ